jgi:hypothetical protein
MTRCSSSRDRDHHDPRRHQGALPAQRIGERTARYQSDRAGCSPHGERQPDVLLRPSQAGEIEGQKRAEAHLHVGHEEIRPIEPAAALIGDFQVAGSPPVTVFRDQPARSR